MKSILYITEDKYPTIIRDVFNPHEITSDDVEIHNVPKFKSVKEIKQYIKEILEPIIKDTLYVVCDSNPWFKQLAKKSTVEHTSGYIYPIPDTDAHICYVPNRTVWFHKPELAKQIGRATIKALIDHFKDEYQEPGNNIIESAWFPYGTQEITNALSHLLEIDKPLTCDIETFSLKHYSSGIAYISFAWDEHNGIAFQVDPSNTTTDESIRELLRNFFKAFNNKLIFHNITFDVYILIYQLYMNGLRDFKGMYRGIDVLLKNWDCSQIISYLATNSTSRVPVGLKSQAQEFAGNYALEHIDNISYIPYKEALEYNLIDTLSTWYVYKKNLPIMVRDGQEDIYNNIFKPAVVDVIQMQLTGLPINIERVKEVADELDSIYNQTIANINNSVLVTNFTKYLNEQWVINKNNTLKKKRVTIEDAKEVFKPNSPVQLSDLLYGMLNLPVLDTTPKGNPSTGNDTLNKLVNHTESQDIKDLIGWLCDLTDVEKIISTYIPHFLNAPRAEDGWNYLYGSFHLGGTISGRLSGSNPSLQTLPSNSRFGKLIKSCVQAPPGWLFVGLDFSSLEDRISALVTKDPNKLAVYLNGYDGHCLRAYYYFKDQMDDIDPNSVDSINSISEKYKALRQKSKEPTFLLTYGGTYFGLMNNCGFSEEEAKSIEDNYHNLYKVSDEYINSKVNKASKDGYMNVAFGLRVRTPLLSQSIRGHSKTPKAVEGEARTIANAIGQSYGMLNSRAVSAFMSQVRNSPHKYDILHCCQIHDASYYMIPDDLEVLMYVNEHLVKESYWQDDPAISHPNVCLGGNLSVFHPSWAKETELPNNATEDEIISLFK